jgi:hypothetical protein
VVVREGGLRKGWTKKGLPPRRPGADVGQDLSPLGAGLDPRLPAQARMSKPALNFAYGPARSGPPVNRVVPESIPFVLSEG